MKSFLKIFIYYLISFILMSNFFYACELKVASYEVPRGLNLLEIFLRMISSDIKMIFFLVIVSIPLIIYITGLYIKRMNEETESLEEENSREYKNLLKNKDEALCKITEKHKELLTLDKLNYKSGIFAGMVSVLDDMRDIYLTESEKINGALILENNYYANEYNYKVLSGLSEKNNGIITFDIDGQMYESQKDYMKSNGYNVKSLNLNDETGIHINLLDYINTKEEVYEASNIIARGNKHKAKLIETIFFLTMQFNDDYEDNNDKDNKIRKTFKDVFEISNLSLNEIEEKSKYVKDAYESYMDLILLDDLKKQNLLNEIRSSLDNFTRDCLNDLSDAVSYKELLNRKSILYIITSSVYSNSLVCNTILLTICNFISKFNSLNKENYTYIYINNLNRFEYAEEIVSRILDNSKENRINFIIGIPNVKEFKDKYGKDAKRIVDKFVVRIFYGLRQRETVLILQDTLKYHDVDIKSIIEELDTNKCIVTFGEVDYVISNISEPDGSIYDKYKYSEQKNSEVISNIKNIDMKLKVDYLNDNETEIDDETKNEFENNSANMNISANTNKSTNTNMNKNNLANEITHEEREFIAGLLKEKSDEYIENKEEKENKNKLESLDNATCEANKESNDDMAERVQEISKFQDKLDEIRQSEKKRLGHALYDQIKRI